MNNHRPDTIDQYIAGFSDPAKLALEQLRATIKNVAPEAQEAIKYGMPAFVWHGNLVFFAAFKSHIGFYGVPTGNPAFANDFLPYKTGKGSIQFPLTKPMPLALISRIVTFRMKENERKAGIKT